MPLQLRALVLQDDVQFLVKLARSMAGRCEWEPPLHALDDAQALGLLARGARPDLLLLDLESPALSGLELLRRLRRELRPRGIPLVVTGARHAPEAERQSFLPGEVWLPKPFDADDLLFAVSLARAGIAADGGATAPAGSTNATA